MSLPDETAPAGPAPALTIWGPGCWDNDAALDLVSDLLDAPLPNARLEDAFTAAPHAASAARAVAAADLAAATRGRPAVDMPEDARELIGLYLVFASDDLLARAETAVAAAAAEGAPLRERWRGDPDEAAWRETVTRLCERLARLRGR